MGFTAVYPSLDKPSPTFLRHEEDWSHGAPIYQRAKHQRMPWRHPRSNWSYKTENAANWSNKLLAQDRQYRHMANKNMNVRNPVSSVKDILANKFFQATHRQKCRDSQSLWCASDEREAIFRAIKGPSQIQNMKPILTMRSTVYISILQISLWSPLKKPPVLHTSRLNSTCFAHACC
jgi:hypothetical protein